MGEGPVRDAAGVLMPAAEALAAAGLAPVELAEKEGLALINGTDGMLGMLVLAIHDLRLLLRTADVAAAMSVEAQMGTDRVFAPELQALRPQVGQGLSAANLVAVLAGSGLMASHRDDFHRVQDAYSLRCSPQVHGAARDTVEHAALVAGRELASAVDNPVVLASRVASSRTATSTGRPSPTSRTSSRSSPPTSPRSASVARTGSSTRPATTTCRRSSPTTPASTAAT